MYDKITQYLQNSTDMYDLNHTKCENKEFL